MMTKRFVVKGKLTAAWLCLIASMNLLTACGAGRGPILGLDGQRAAIRVLVQAADRSPAAGLSVVLKKDTTPIGTPRTTDGSGIAEFPDVPVGDGYRAYVNGRGYQSGVTDSVKVMGNVEVPLQLTPLSATGTGILVGSVKEAKGAPIAGAQVTCGPRSVATNAAGQFTFANMPAGRFPLAVAKPGFSAAAKPDVTVTVGDVVELDTLFLREVAGAASAITGGGQYLLATAGRVAEVDRNWGAPWRFGGVTLVAGAARLPSGEVAIADAGSRKVLVVDRAGKVLFTYGGTFTKLKSPGWVAADKMTGNLLITDTDGDQLIELTGRNVSWTSKGPWKSPRSATYTPTGTILVADTGNKAVAEVDRMGHVIWSFAGPALSRPVHAQRLASGNTLITDAGFNRVIEVDPKGKYVWHYDGQGGSRTAGFAVRAQMVRGYDAASDVPNFVPPAGSTPVAGAGGEPVNPGNEEPVAQAPAAGLNLPRMATRLANGNTLIADNGNGRVLEVSPDGQTVWQNTTVGRVSAIEKLGE
ncbi:MAG: carboxypeptidase regulatory-like domain-containing protein [Candidatus Sericytochromatia bacterium]|nr:carboxypeptidase regulatory-like domain-containing protein [Candidatus Sericytochromatia bacterium]